MDGCFLERKLESLWRWGKMSRIHSKPVSILSSCVALSVGVSACSSASDSTTDASGFAATEITIGSPATETLVKTRAVLEANRPTDVQLKLITRIILEDGGVVEFYEPAPGYLLLSGFSGGGPSLEELVPNFATMPATDVFKTLAPHHAVPGALDAAQLRMNARLVADPSSVTLAEFEGRATRRMAQGRGSREVATQSERGIAHSSDGLPAIMSNQPPHTESGGVLLGCLAGVNWCSIECWQTTCPRSGGYTWCYPAAYDGASASTSGAYREGYGAACGVTGYPQFDLVSDAYGGSWVVYPQYDRWARTSHCGIVFPVIICGTQHIEYSLHGANTMSRFSGYYN